MLSEVQGQTEGVRILQRVVEGHLRSPLLLVGPEGVGRRFSVIEAAKDAFSKGNPKSPHCKRIQEGVHPDFVLVQPQDGKDLGIEAIRDVVSKALSFPSTVPVRYVVIEKVESMTGPAANALLKTLEEQPPTTRFFLLSESADRVIPTIRSRCGLVRYRPLPEDFVVDYIKDLTDNPTKALVCARLSEGSVGLAYQFLASGRLSLRNKMLKLLEFGLSGDFSSLFSVVDDVESDLDRGLHFLSHLLCDLIMLPHAPDRISDLDIAEELGSLRTRLGEQRLEKLLRGLQELRSRRGNIQLPFHTKTYIASAFTG